MEALIVDAGGDLRRRWFQPPCVQVIQDQVEGLEPHVAPRATHQIGHMVRRLFVTTVALIILFDGTVTSVVIIAGLTEEAMEVLAPSSQYATVDPYRDPVDYYLGIGVAETGDVQELLEARAEFAEAQVVRVSLNVGV